MTYTHCRGTTRTDGNSRFFMNNMTNSLRKLKKSYSENTEFSCFLFPYPLSVQGTAIGIQQTFLGITSISLSAVSLYCTVNAFFFAKLTENFFYMIKTKTLRASKRLTLHSSDWFAFWRLLFNRRSLKFLIKSLILVLWRCENWCVYLSITLYDFKTH